MTAANSDNPTSGLNALVLAGRRHHLRRRRFAGRERRRQRIAARQRGGDGQRRGGTQRRIGLEAAQDHALDRRIEIAHDGRRRRRSCRLSCSCISSLSVFASKHALAREDLEQHQAERVDVGLARRGCRP